MTFAKPFAAYIAASNLEAHFVCNLLNDGGIHATVIDDVSQAGVWLGGLVSQIHKPQVWIEEADADRARPMLNEYEQHLKDRLYPETSDGLIEVRCEKCGELTSFPASQKGSVQECPHCNAYIDVGEVEGDMEWNQVPEDEETEPTDS